ncbi:galactokinase [Rubrobacter calidifluminis]|uniref:galactokinase n=1 Tax=Rubrobacter calidifluminis TaxID=1392640 RepID=UPI00235ECE6A|nr:galactokinase [Rubrobacter calidifluminis]
MREVEGRAAEAYRERFDADPEVVASAPGRVNLIGEHTDYNGGFVLPCAIDRRVAVAAGRGEGILYSADFDETRPLTPEEKNSWADYPRGVAWALGEAGCAIGPFRAAFAGEVPRGSGLSSSAAIEAATALALGALFGLEVDRKDLARICQRAENEYVGVQSGIMDQYASLLCHEGAALLVDCRTLEAEDVPLDLEGAGLVLLVCDTRVERGLAGTGYNERRRSCEEAARRLGVRELRDTTEGDLPKLSGELLRRARHVVTENGRVLEAARALRAGDYASFGRLMYASHASLRDDYEVSTPELDAFVECAREVGAPGARLTGAGFGGCAMALVEAGRAEALARRARERFSACGFREPLFYRFLPAPGAEVLVL